MPFKVASTEKPAASRSRRALRAAADARKPLRPAASAQPAIHTRSNALSPSSGRGAPASVEVIKVPPDRATAVR